MISLANRVCILVTVVLLAPAAALAGGKEPASKKDVTVTLKIADKTSGLSLEAKKAVAHDSNAFDAMRHVVSVTYKTDPESGPMVTGLCGVTAPKGCFWAAYVDGTLARTGIGRLALTKDTVIEWKIERIGDK